MGGRCPRGSPPDVPAAGVPPEKRALQGRKMTQNPTRGPSGKGAGACGMLGREADTEAGCTQTGTGKGKGEWQIEQDEEEG